VTFNSSTTTTTPDEEPAPWCAAMPGVQPHNYQPVVDLVGGTGIWLYCNQCGDVALIDGTAAPKGSPSTGAPPTSAPSGQRPFP
jgi:hypothetical protein